MATKDIPDVMVCRAYAERAAKRSAEPYEFLQDWPYEILKEWTGQPEKVCERAMERAERRGLIEYGVSLRSGWLTEKGKALLEGKSIA